MLHRRLADAPVNILCRKEQTVPMSRSQPYPTAAISRVALIGSFNVLHNAVRFAFRGRQ